MAQPPQRSYQRPAPPLLHPLQRQPGAPAPHQPWQPPDPKKPRRSRWLRLTLAALAVLLVALAAIKLTAGPQRPAGSSVAQNPYRPTNTGPADSFSQRYRLSIPQGGKALTIFQVEVSGLRRRTATIRYTVSFDPQLAWPARRDSYQLRSRIRYTPVNIEEGRMGSQRRATITFRAPTRQVLRGARLILLPSSPRPLQLGLEIPARQRSAPAERHGAGAVR